MNSTIEPPSSGFLMSRLCIKLLNVTCQSTDAPFPPSATSRTRFLSFPPNFDYTDGWMHGRNHGCTLACYLFAYYGGPQIQWIKIYFGLFRGLRALIMTLSKAISKNCAQHRKGKIACLQIIKCSFWPSCYGGWIHRWKPSCSSNAVASFSHMYFSVLLAQKTLERIRKDILINKIRTR
jgi:hypothetical protein